MSNLKKLQFVALDITGKNYLSWILDAEMHLKANNLEDTIKEGRQASDQDKAKAMIFLRHHLHEGLKIEYLTIKDPLVLWNNLKERYDHQKTVIRPKAHYDWMHLRLQDFKSVIEYNSAMFRISSQLKLCGENITDKDMLEKTFSTFHASKVLLQQQYREKGFNKYSELISCLLVAEQNNELLMRNHESRPTSSTPFQEANVVAIESTRSHGRGRGRGRGCGRSCGRDRGHGGGRSHQKWANNDGHHQKESSGNNNHVENLCYCCGGTPKHLVDLYQESLKNIRIKIKAKSQRWKQIFWEKKAILIKATWMLLIWMLLISLPILMEELIT
ncbi:uncharacterized protein LOC114745922 [Neltuma alba]|uniref:uncharacterized protein LOC114745922 n=1 Tax=Neltuma alba TaxID=207710 RepID=UPI0010A38FB8|nr:uncharacterized protein LOC114745922 [Prosopis alba]